MVLLDNTERDDVARSLAVLLEARPVGPSTDWLIEINMLGDQQWHTYEPLSPELKAALEAFLKMHWVESQEFLEEALGCCYYFGLGKGLYRRALDLYAGEFKAEYEEILAKSPGVAIDPWWSMRKQG